MKKKFDTSSFKCQNIDCEKYHKDGTGHIKLHYFGGKNKNIAYLKCKICNVCFSERKGTFYYNKKKDKETINRALTATSEGLGIRATGRTFGIYKGTISAWVKEAGEHCFNLEKKIFKNIPLEEAQFDEYWGFVFKKEYNLSESEKFLETIGDAWTFTSILPTEKLIIAHSIGKRIKINAIKLLAQLKARTKSGNTLHFSTDGNDVYIDAISSQFGVYDKCTKELLIPKNLCYTQVVKHIEKGKCIKVDRKIIFGNDELLQKCLDKSEVSNEINTAFIERSNLTLRQHNHRIERKSQGFSKDIDYLKYQTSLSIFYYNFCLPHKSLTIFENENKIKRTPAMATNLTNHIWSIESILTYQCFPN